MNRSYKIYDWAANRLGSKTFATYEDAWDYIYGELTDKLGLTDEDYQEYYVEDKADRETRFLDPNDLRSGWVGLLDEQYHGK